MSEAINKLASVKAIVNLSANTKLIISCVSKSFYVFYSNLIIMLSKWISLGYILILINSSNCKDKLIKSLLVTKRYYYFSSFNSHIFYNI